jgi:hypothetical protein
VANAARSPLIQRRPPPELRHYGSQGSLRSVSPLYLTVIPPFVQREHERPRDYDRRNRTWTHGRVSQQLEKPFGGTSIERLRDRPLVGRQYSYQAPEQLFIAPFLGATLGRLTDRPIVSRPYSYTWNLGLLLTAPFFGATLARSVDKPTANRAFSYGFSHEALLTLPFFGVTLERARDEPHYLYDRTIWRLPLPTVVSTQILQLPVDYYMEGLPQYRELGRTFEPGKGEGGEVIIVERGKGGRLSKTVSTFTTKTNNKGYD